MSVRILRPPAVAALLLLSAVAFARAGGPASAPSEKEGLAALPDEDRKWLTEFVAPIILPEEKKAFLELTQPYEREKFKQEFWNRRERDNQAPPLGFGYKERYAELRQLADTQYDRWPNDAAAMVIRHGEPASINKLESCGDTGSDIFRGLEIWTYDNAGGLGRGLHYLFYRQMPLEPRRMWTVGTPDSAIFTATGRVKSFRDLAGACNGSSLACADACEVYRAWTEISSRQGSPSGGQMERARLTQEPDKISLEGLDAIKQQSPNTTDPNARKLTVEGPVSGAAAGAPQTATAAATPAKAAPKLSEKEQIAAFSEDDRKWLTEFVAPIILAEEKKAFLELTEPHEREAFKREFWKRREQDSLPPPMGPGYEARYAELRRIADDQYDRWPHDAARMVIRYGEPAGINKIETCGTTSGTDLFRGLEIWTYTSSSNSVLGGARHYFFYRRTPQEPRRLWTVGTPDSDVFTPGSCRKTFQDLQADCVPTRGDPCAGSSCTEACEVYRTWNEISSRQGSQTGGQMEEAQLLSAPPISLEGLDSIRQKSVNSTDPNAKKLSVEGPGSTVAAAPGAGTSAQKSAASTPAPVRRKLSKKEIKEATDKLDQKYKDFLLLVDLIITDDERQVFLQIGDDYQKDRFVETFWKRRSIDSRGMRTDFKAIYTDRYKTAKEEFRNLNSDRAKVFLVNGAPDALIPIDCTGVFVPIQIWYYDRIEALKSKVYLLFYKQMGVGDYRLWLPLDGENVLYEGGGISGLQAPGHHIDVTQCAEWRTIRQAMAYESTVLGTGAMSMAGASVLFQPPTVETEGVDQILSMTTDVAANAATIGVTKLIRFPDERANKIGVDLSLLVPKSELKSRQLGDETFYNVDVIGEVVKEDRLIDNFKYRFDLPVDEISADKIPLTVRRYLYPGDYKLVLKISDGNQNAEGRITDALKVPEKADEPPPLEAAARAQGRVTLRKAEDASILPAAITLLPIAKEIATGLQRFETRAAEGISAVDFFLNGTKVMTRTRSPFDADLNLGPLPRKQVVRVVAYGPNGRAVGEDEYIVNEGREVFRVRIMSPEKGARVTGNVPVLAAVAVPEGKALQKIEFYSNENRVATLYQPPWEQTVNVKDNKSIGYVRVVGTLDDGTLAEDVRYVNAPAYISEVSVDAVELYTAVTDHGGRPVSGLQATSFKVFEDGALQKIESFEYVKNVPLALGILIDTSASMLESLPEAQQAATTFLDYSIGAKDRAFTISFDNEPYVLSKLTNRKEKLYRSLAGLRAEGSTALYDAVVYGLYQFTGVKGKKALVILTDGKDTASKFDYDTLLEYVRKSGIAIYAIGLKIPAAELEVKYKLNKLAQVTGGQTFMIDSAKNLESIYRQINDELRSQYLLTYYSSNTTNKEKWRKVEVKVEPTNLSARTLSGYYP